MKIIEYGIMNKNLLSRNEQNEIMGRQSCSVDACGAHACGVDSCAINLCGARACGANVITICGAWAWIWAT
jgi:hypothetical protein